MAIAGHHMANVRQTRCSADSNTHQLWKADNSHLSSSPAKSGRHRSDVSKFGKGMLVH